MDTPDTADAQIPTPLSVEIIVGQLMSQVFMVFNFVAILIFTIFYIISAAIATPNRANCLSSRRLPGGDLCSPCGSGPDEQRLAICFDFDYCPSIMQAIKDVCCKEDNAHGRLVETHMVAIRWL